MFDDPGFVLGAVALGINVATTVGVLVRLRLSPDAYDGAFETFRATAKQVVARGVALAFLLVVLFAVVGASPSAVGLGPESATTQSVLAGVGTGAALVLAAVASRAVVTRFGWEADSSAWATLWPDSPLEWAIYLPSSWLSSAVDTTIFVAFVLGGLTTGTTPTAYALAAVTALLAGGKSAWEGPGVVVRSSTTFLVLGVAFVLTRSWPVLAVALAVNHAVFGLQDNAEKRYGTATAAD
ncbi:hypothetical protein [Haloarchaeobius baliensis]|uniref:hypothetical protein n=1 Tax=Haloarchaeobius baliensis TaxID=1670458 RepID=UPI003F8859B1